MDALRRAFNDIVLGYTRERLFDRTVYVKHLSYADQIDNDAKRDEYYRDAESKGLHTVAQKLVLLAKEGGWTAAQEKELTTIKTRIADLIDGKKKQMKMPSLVKHYAEQIKKEEAIYAEKTLARYRALGLTCESYADRYLNDWYLYTNLFSDKGLNVPFFEETDFDYLDETRMGVVTDLYNAAIGTCSEINIKRLAMQPFFQNYFGLTGDMLGQFFGKPICQLTFFQVRLLSLGAHFRNIYGSHDTSKFPANVREDPDLLTDYAAAAKQGKEDMEKQGAYDGESIVVGAKREDAEVLGVKTRTSMAADIARSGGNMVSWLQKGG